MTHPAPMSRADASVVTSSRGVPWWGAVLIALIPTLAGVAFDLAANDEFGWIARILAVLGCVIAVLAVRRRSIFTPMVQPPLVIAGSILVSYLVLSSQSFLTLSVYLVDSFSTMVVATAAGLILGMVRYIAQPLHGSRAA